MAEDDSNSNPNPKTTSRCVAFASTLLANASLVGIIGAYSMIKVPFNEKFGVEEDFFGIV